MTSPADEMLASEELTIESVAFVSVRRWSSASRSSVVGSSSKVSPSLFSMEALVRSEASWASGCGLEEIAICRQQGDCELVVCDLPRLPSLTASEGGSASARAARKLRTRKKVRFMLALIKSDLWVAVGVESEIEGDGGRCFDESEGRWDYILCRHESSLRVGLAAQKRIFGGAVSERVKREGRERRVRAGAAARGSVEQV